MKKSIRRGNNRNTRAKTEARSNNIENKPPPLPTITADDSVSNAPNSNTLKASPNKRPKSSLAEIAGIGLAAVVGLLLFGVGYLQWRVYSQQAKIMAADHRPWLAIDDYPQVFQPVTFDDRGTSVGIEGKIRNGGKSIALNVAGFESALIIEPYTPEHDPFRPENFEAFMDRALRINGCSKDIAEQYSKMGGTIIFPDKSVAWRPGDNGIVRLRKHPVPSDATSIITSVSIWMEVCIFYRDDGNNAHSTPIILYFIDSSGRSDIHTPDGKSPVQPVTIDGKFLVITNSKYAY